MSASHVRVIWYMFKLSLSPFISPFSPPLGSCVKLANNHLESQTHKSKTQLYASSIIKLFTSYFIVKVMISQFYYN